MTTTVASLPAGGAGLVRYGDICFRSLGANPVSGKCLGDPHGIRIFGDSAVCFRVPAPTRVMAAGRGVRRPCLDPSGEQNPLRRERNAIARMRASALAAHYVGCSGQGQRGCELAIDL